ncbi:MAG TPA: hypothetical protein VJ850_09030 [Candidatus Limnocylindrales bacterium]|nr:hypothetical protein [Candidatus Limnocylindrales bacterium]
MVTTMNGRPEPRDPSPELLQREKAGRDRLAELRTYYAYVHPLVWMAATSGNALTLTPEQIVQRLIDAGERGLPRERLMESYEAFVAAQRRQEAVEVAERWPREQQPYNTPDAEPSDPVEERPAPFSRADIGSRATRRSQGPVGRHERYVRLQAGKLGLSPKVYDRRVKHHPQGCPWQVAS